MSVPTAGSLPAGCELVPAQRRGARPARISCDLGRVVVPLTKTSRVRWVLAWRLTVTGLSGRAASARVHEGRRGENGPALHELCRPCGVRSSGRVVIAAKRAMAVIGGATYLTVGTAKRPRSELRGQIARTRLGVRARLSALTHTPKVDTRWPYAVRVTDLRGKAVRARVTVEIVDPFGGVHPVEFGGSDDTVADHRFTGTFRDYVIWPPESAIPGIELVFRPTVRTASGTVVLTYTVSPRRAEGRVAVARPPGERTGV